jgi:indolepyruvate ferredoxin oxidoreductase
MTFPPVPGLDRGIDRVTRKADNVYLDGQALAEGLSAIAMATNNFMVGVAFQAGDDSAQSRIDRERDQATAASQSRCRCGVPLGTDGRRRSRFVEAEARKGAGSVRRSAACAASLLRMRARIVDSVGAQGETKRLLEIRVARPDRPTRTRRTRSATQRSSSASWLPSRGPFRGRVRSPRLPHVTSTS